MASVRDARHDLEEVLVLVRVDLGEVVGLLGIVEGDVLVNDEVKLVLGVGVRFKVIGGASGEVSGLLAGVEVRGDNGL